MLTRKQIAAIIDPVYPGLLDEAQMEIEVIQLTGALDATFVQVPRKTIISSPALLNVVGKEGTYQSEVVNTQGIQRRELSGVTYMSTTSEAAFYVQTEPCYPEEALWTPQYTSQEITDSNGNTMGPSENNALSTTFGTTPVVMSLDQSIVPQPTEASLVNDWMAQPWFKYGYDALMAMVSSLNTSAKVGVFVGGSTGTAAGVSWSGSVEADIKRTNHKFNTFPNIPGYSKLSFYLTSNHAESGGSDVFIFTTYVTGRADIQYDFGLLPYLSGSYKVTTFGVKSFNQFTTTADAVILPRFTAGNVMPVGLAFAPTELTALLRRDVVNINVYNEPSVMLFGPPAVKFYADGTTTYNELILDDTDDRNWVLNVINIEVNEYLWVLDREWYKKYMETGFYIFTPRVSNIRQNVLKEWDALEYSTITIRSTAEGYSSMLDVEKLPEAKAYAKGRAKACRDNDWLKQVAVADSSITWAEVSTKEKAARPRSIWMNNVAFAPRVPDYNTSMESTIVEYELLNGVVTRKEGELAKTMDVANEDDQAQITYDRYYNSLATVTGGTWDDVFPLDASEKELLSDKLGNFASVPSYSNATAVGFANWIDPTGCNDIRNLTEEQRYRLHVKNSLFLDRMSAPLTRVIASFGLDTLTKYAAKLKA